ncbi:hypothetical protein TGFOU_404330 [Toxoplasma gondii FOU]|uniref:Uncharacterized protein n=1 Tax=Toxoplasma gondii FOU TaxID=943167 RepID=A0A086L499_TOXGO|nr:hypothetical protein TGFOU_404330 [Toxoplasma gondii FOU]
MNRISNPVWSSHETARKHMWRECIYTVKSVQKCRRHLEKTGHAHGVSQSVQAEDAFCRLFYSAHTQIHNRANPSFRDDFKPLGVSLSDRYTCRVPEALHGPGTLFRASRDTKWKRFLQSSGKMCMLLICDISKHKRRGFSLSKRVLPALPPRELETHRVRTTHMAVSSEDFSLEARPSLFALLHLTTRTPCSSTRTHNSVSSLAIPPPPSPHNTRSPPLH